MFLQSRREDVSVRAREGMLRNLEKTYFDYVDLRDHFIAAVQVRSLPPYSLSMI